MSFLNITENLSFILPRAYDKPCFHTHSLNGISKSGTQVLWLSLLIFFRNSYSQGIFPTSTIKVISLFLIREVTRKIFHRVTVLELYIYIFVKIFHGVMKKEEKTTEIRMLINNILFITKRYFHTKRFYALNTYLKKISIYIFFLV